VEAQRAAGIMMVVAAGNAGSACGTVNDPPGIYDAVYSIGALNEGQDTIASFSSRGPVTVDGSNRPKPDISAPGTSIRSSTRNAVLTNSYGNLSGTSMASPHVAGAVALLWSAQPQLRNDVDRTEVVLNDTAFHILANTCNAGSPPVSPNNTFGHGRLDIKTAVDRALTSILAISRAETGPITLEGRGAPNFPHTIEASPDLSPDSFGPIDTVTTDPTGMWHYDDPAATGLSMRFYRLVFP
jgi:subtilisin family serine protease